MMSLEEIRIAALALPEKERAALVAALLKALPESHHDVSDDEVTARDQELQSGKVIAISHDEFVRGVMQDRHRNS